MAARVTVAELFGRQVAIDWFEAVAILRGLCESLSRRGDRELALPELSEMAITSDGEIDVTDVTVLSEPIRRLGQLLQALLRNSQPPTTLRLVISQATAAPPVYQSLGEFDAALGYFERPDRPAVLRAVFDRASAVSSGPEPVPPERLDEVAPLPAPEPKRKIPPQARRKGIAVAIGAGILLALTMTATQALRSDAARRAGLEAATERVGARVDRAVLSGVSAVTQWAGLGKLTTDPAPAGAPATAPVSPKGGPRPRGSIASRQGGLIQAVPALEGFDLLPAVMTTPMMAPLVEPVSVGTPDRTPQPDLRVYSPADTTVRPPVAIRPQLPSELPEGVTVEQLTRFELVIAADGTVESVKLLPGARNTTVNESMMLSAAKAWRFSPATRGDQRVRYRKTVWIRQL